MKTTGKIKYFSVWIGIIAYLVLSIGGFQEMVLCHEKDGTVSLELAVNGVCSDALEGLQASASQPITSFIEIDCKQCFDQPLSMLGLAPSDSINPTPTYIMQDIVTPALPIFAVGHLITATSQLLPQPPPRMPEIHRFLSPVILLI